MHLIERPCEIGEVKISDVYVKENKEQPGNDVAFIVDVKIALTLLNEELVLQLGEENGYTASSMVDRYVEMNAEQDPEAPPKSRFGRCEIKDCLPSSLDLRVAGLFYTLDFRGVPAKVAKISPSAEGISLQFKVKAMLDRLQLGELAAAMAGVAKLSCKPSPSPQKEIPFDQAA